MDDPATSDSLPRSDGFPRCVWRATSGSASDGHRASSHSSDRGSREHDCAHDATKSLVDHLGSHCGQMFPVSHACLSREPGSCALKAFAASDGVVIERKPLSRSPQCRGRRDGELLAGDENQGPEKTQLLHDRGLRESSLPTKRLRRIRPWGREANGASSFVSSSDEERKSAGRARVLQRRGRARVRELVKMAESMPEEAKRLSALRTKSVTRKDPGGCTQHPSANFATGAACRQTAM